LVSVRNERIAEQVRGELARLIREETSDPRIGLLTLTRVKLSPDLSTATVFWSPLESGEAMKAEEIEQGLASAAGFLRTRLAAGLSLRRTPALSFRHDRSIEEGSRTLALLRSLPEFAREGVDSAFPKSGEGEKGEGNGEEG